MTPEHEQREQTVTAQDRLVLDRVDELLVDESQWNPKCDRRCPPGAARLSLFCALQRAVIEVFGEYRHRCAALQFVRFAVEDAAPAERFDHRLRDFNNTRDFAAIKAVVADARSRVAERLDATGGNDGDAM